MNLFVSYARKDNVPSRLHLIDHLLQEWGKPYIDDLHHSRDVSRHDSTVRALRTADAFVAVLTPTYLSTPWTRFEFRHAATSKIPLLVLTTEHLVYRGSYEVMGSEVARAFRW